jgi:D-ribose pyranose/furanose isomerase RbsD
LRQLDHGCDWQGIYGRRVFEGYEEFTQKKFLKSLEGIEVGFEPHLEFKKRVPKAIGLIRTADTVQYANI